MNDKLQTLQDDIAFLKTLAEEGRAPPTLGGSIMVAAGLVFGAASVAQWAILTGLVKVTPWALPVVWLVAVALFMAIMSGLRSGMGGTKTAGGRASGVAWTGVGWTIFTLSASVALVCWRAHSGVPTLLFPSIVLSLYGLGWLVAATVSKKRWILVVAIGSYLAAMILAAVSITPAVMLYFTGALMLLAVVPGVALMRTAPTAAA
jgi:hypothetical protein